MNAADQDPQIEHGLDFPGDEGGDPARGPWRVGKVCRPHHTLQGWLLAAPGVEVRGIRALCGGRDFVAKRKQLRLDVMQMFPARDDALHAGFKVELELRAGSNVVTLQYKDANRKWRDFERCVLRLPRLWKIARWFGRTTRETGYGRWYREHMAASAEELARQAAACGKEGSGPLISILTPVYNPPLKWLERMIESVLEQTYPRWELCLADDKSSDPRVRAALEKAAAKDPRIKVVFREENGHICRASNSALELCTGGFTALLDNDDELSPDALYQVVQVIQAAPDAEMIFSDEDKIDEEGVISDPYFKMGWNPELFLHQNCFSHFGVFRTALLRRIGGFRPGLEGSQDWDLTLRAMELVPRSAIRHIPRVLYHWRILATSTAGRMEAKPYARLSGQKAVGEHLSRAHPAARVVETAAGWRVEWPLPEPAPRVSLIIPTRDRVDLLRVAVDSLFQLTDYPDIELVIVDHESREEATREYLTALSRERPNVRTIRVEGVFNWPRLNNLGVRAATGPVLVFLNNDVEITDPGWLREMVSQACRADVGAVGACLLFPDGSIQHAGVVLGMTGVAGHVFRRGRFEAPSIGGAPGLTREVTAVTGACMAVRREVFEKSGGFDEENLPVNYNDIDFCLRLRSLGYRNIYTAFARMTHHESVSRGDLEKQSARKAEASREAQIVLTRWPAEFVQDAFYNPNLSKSAGWPALG